VLKDVAVDACCLINLLAAETILPAPAVLQGKRKPLSERKDPLGWKRLFTSQSSSPEKASTCFGPMTTTKPSS